MVEAMGASFGLTLAGCLILVGVTGAAVYFFMRGRHSGEPMSFEQMQMILAEEVKNVRELVTVRKNFKSRIIIDDDKKIPWLDVHIPGSSRKLCMEYSGTIVFGCDLNAIQLRRDANSVQIIVPPSRILDAYADVNSLQILYQDTGLLAKKIELTEQNELIKDDLAKERQRALQAGLLTRADENVRQTLNSIIARRGLNRGFDIEIVQNALPPPRR